MNKLELKYKIIGIMAMSGNKNYLLDVAIEETIKAIKSGDLIE